MKEISRHVQHYLPLIGILVAGALGFFIFGYDRSFQTAIIISTACGYLAWGIVHHYIHRDLHLSVIFEYITIALLGTVLVLSIILRA